MAKKVVIDLELKYKEATQNLDEFQKEYTKLEKQTTDQNQSTAKSIKNIEKASQSASKGIKAISGSIKALGIGLVIAAFTQLKEVFEQNQKVADLFSNVFETISIVFNQFVGVIVDVYENVSKSTENFDALGSVLKGLLTLALTPLKLAFNGIKLGVQEVQLAWEKSFFGDKDPKTIKELNKNIEATKETIYQIGAEALESGKSIVKNFGEAVGEVTNIATQVVEGVSKISVKEAYKSAKANVELGKQAEIAAVRQQGLVESYDRQAEKLRQIRDEERNTISERILANDKLKEVLDEQETAMLKQVDLQIGAAAAQYNKNKSQENYIALLEAQQEREAVLAQIEGFRSEQLSNDLALSREKQELTQTQIDSETELAINQKQFNAEQIENEYLRLQALKDVAIQEKDLEVKRLEDKRDLYKQGTQAYQDAQNELDAFSQASAQKQLQINKNLQKAKYTEEQKALGGIANIVGQNSKYGKAIAVISAIRDTYTGANKALAQGGIYGFIGAAAVIAGGLSNVKQITASKDPAPPSFAKSGGGGSVSAPSVPSAPPSFNIVGSSDTNQLAEAIGSQEQKPVKAYVTSNDVTTAQGLDRNIVEGASIG